MNNNDVSQKISLFEEDIKKLEKTYGIIRKVSLEFPQYRIYPDELKLAILILKRHDPKFVYEYKEIENASIQG